MIGIGEMVPNPIHIQPNHSSMSFLVRDLGETLTVLRFLDVVTMGGALAVVCYKVCHERKATGPLRGTERLGT
jgi:hypothetical protein